LEEAQSIFNLEKTSRKHEEFNFGKKNDELLLNSVRLTEGEPANIFTQTLYATINR